ncbi:MAG: biotin--[acetyl-CoA-carboxylase] ligase [Rhodobacterales bacterium 12-64-8]|nr:MAG: biotin--[acetyl-CoA-carboxylase] ligase [Rhodobacterales bacterium 12-64-8]OYX47927.1 MAG: biotin--[acetyl-CoA-carboxylase] ligase [Alphaproteobacteria bacterium 32-64-14]
MVVETLSQAWPIVRFGEIDSTNEEARRRASQSEIGPCWLVTEEQTAGRGRLGRAWSSPRGNLFTTALLPYPRPPAEAALACFAAGLAVLDAARSAGVDVTQAKLKWPNDVLVGNAKLCGILIETGQLHGKLWMAAGFGVNVEVAPERADRLTTCLADMPGGAGLTAAGMLTGLDMAFRVRLRSLLVDGFEPTRADWLAHAAHLGARVELTPASGRIEGVMTGLAPDGALIVRLADGSETHVRAGEISLLS